MNQRIGKYILQEIIGEHYKAYIPPKLPLDPPIDLTQIYPYLEEANLALAELNSITRSIPNTSLFVYMYVRKEALLSSQIEGTQSSLSDLMLFEHNLKPTVSLDDVEEVSNYVKAIKHGINRLNNNFPLTLRLLREIHGILLSGSRGSTKLPGEFRRSQNWIGGTRPGNALFVPPPAESLNDCLANFERFLHDDTLPLLVKTAIAHVQFESIHPFLDGNGRLGRLLIVLLLCDRGRLDEPVLYLSFYLKLNRTQYYELLQAVRHNGTWETWIEFFLKGIISTSKQTLTTIKKINRLFENDSAKIESLGRARFSCAQVLEYLKKLPQVTVQFLSQELKMSLPTARSSLNHMISLGILKEISGKQRDKVFVYQKYLNILEEKTLIEAVKDGNIETVKQLLNSEDVNDYDVHDGKTALHWASQFAECSSYPFEILESLLSRLDIDVNIRDYPIKELSLSECLNSDRSGRTPLYYAAENGWIKAVNLLTPKTDYEGLRKAHDVARSHTYTSRLDDRNKILKILATEINSRPEHQKILNEGREREERLKQKQREGYVPCIESLYELYEKDIFPLYNRYLITKELEDAVEKLDTEEHSSILATFRRNYQGSNIFEAESSNCLQEKYKKLNEEVKKYDNEVIPTYHIIKYMEASGEAVDTIKFSSKEQDSLRYDASLSLRNKKICLELTRSIDGQQKNNKKQLLRQNGSAFSSVIDNRIKEPVIEDPLYYLNNTGEVTYNKKTKTFNQEVPLAQGDLHQTLYPSKLRYALQEKLEKNHPIKEEKYWLVITIDMGIWSEYFNETCKIFYETCLKDIKTSFKRIFVFLENNYSSEKTRRIWDSQDPENVH